MAMERVTVEQNGERFTLDVPEGTSDADIQKFLSQQQQPSQGTMTTAPANPTDNVGAYAAQSGATAYNKYLQATGGGIIGDTAKVAKALGQATPEVIGEVLAHPVQYAQDFVKSYAAGLPLAKTPLSQIPGMALKGVASAAVAPENLMTLPYNMAAYEQAKIRENPYAPGLESNPYAQVVRGEVGRQAPSTLVARQPVGTQAMAGEANRMKALANMPYGNVSPQERAMLEEDARMRSAIRKKAFEKVMGPVAPGQF
jgi:hypothetical protein